MRSGDTGWRSFILPATLFCAGLLFIFQDPMFSERDLCSGDNMGVYQADNQARYARQLVGEWNTDMLGQHVGGAFIPQYLIAVLLPPRHYNYGMFLIDAILTALAGFYFLRGRGSDRLPSAFGGVAFALSGYFFTLISAGHRGVFHTMPYVPMVFGLLDRGIARGSVLHLACAGVCAAYAVSASSDVGLLFVMLAAAYALFRVVQKCRAAGVVELGGIGTVRPAFRALGFLRCLLFKTTFSGEIEHQGSEDSEGPKVLGTAGGENALIERTLHPGGGVQWGKLVFGGALAAVCAALVASGFLESWIKGGMATRKAQMGVVADKGAEEPKKDTWEFATNWSMPPEEILEFFAPCVFGVDVGDPETPYWGRLGRTLGWEQTKRGFRNFKQHTLYMGVLQLVFAAYLLWRLVRRRPDDPEWMKGWRSEAIFWTVAFIVALFLALGRYFPPPYRLWHAVPGLSLMRCPVKFVHLCELAVCVLFAMGLQVFRRDVSGKRESALSEGSAPADPHPELLASFAAFCSRSVSPERLNTKDAKIAKGGEHREGRGPAIPRSSPNVTDRRHRSGRLPQSARNGPTNVGPSEKNGDLLGFAIAAFASAVIFWMAAAILKSNVHGLDSYLASIGFGERSSVLSTTSVGALVRAGFLFAVAAVVFLSGWLLRGAKWAPGVLCGVVGAIVVFDMAAVGRRYVFTRDISPAFERNAVVTAISSDKSHGRTSYIMPGRINANPFYGSLYHNGVELVDPSDDVTLPGDYEKYFRALSKDPVRLWMLTSTTHILGTTQSLLPLFEHPAFSLVSTFTFRNGSPEFAEGRNAPFALVTFRGSLPRALVYYGWESVAKEKELDRLVARDWNPFATALVEESVGSSASTNRPTGVEIAEISPWRVRLRALADGDGLLVLNDKYDEHWRAMVDGKPAEILRCNYIMRGVRLAPGRHEVVFAYRRQTLMFLMSLLPLIGIAAAVAVCSIRARRHRKRGVS